MAASVPFEAGVDEVAHFPISHVTSHTDALALQTQEQKQFSSVSYKHLHSGS